jgi:hypothetical protein
MTELRGAAIMLLLLLGGSGFGMLVRPFLSERHRSRETTDLIQLVLIMLVTFAGLMLGLLTSSVKTSFDTINDDLRGYSVELIQLDRSLREYGSDGNEARESLRGYIAAAIASTWTDEPKPPGDYYPKQVSPPPSSGSIEAISLGDTLARVEDDLRRLEPQDPLHRRLALTMLNQFEQVMRLRWKLIEEAHGSISMPFYLVLAFWLVIIFASFGLSAPHNAVTYVTIGLGALSIASVVFVILDLDTPFTGLFMVSSEPLREALSQFAR